MQAHLTPEQLESYRRRQASPVDLLAMDDHLAVCTACREQVRVPHETAVTALPSVFREDGLPPEHLDFEQLADYVDGALVAADLETVRSHLEVCPACVAEVRDLAAFREELEGAPLPGSSSRPSRTSVWSWCRLALPAAAAAVLVVTLLRIPLPAEIGTPTGRELAQARKEGTAAREEAERLSRELAQVKKELAAVDRRRVGEVASRERQSQEMDRLRERLEDLEISLARSPIPRSVPGAGETRPATVVRDGNGELVRDAEGRLVRLVPQAVLPEVERAWKTRRLEPPVLLAQLTGAPRRDAEEGTARFVPPPGSPAFALKSPVGTAVRDDRPELAWVPLVGAEGYIVTIFDLEGFALETSPRLKATRWQPANSLPRGRTYQWEVAAYAGETRLRVTPRTGQPEARFVILEANRAAELERAVTAGDGSLVTRGVLAWRAGLLDEAEEAFQSLVRENPGSREATALLHGLRQLRRQVLKSE